MKLIVLAFFVVINNCYGQFDLLLPGVKVGRELVEGFNNNPLVNMASEASEDILITAFRVINGVPLAIARNLNIDTMLPLIGIPRSAIDDYNAGLGNEDARLDIRQIINKYRYRIEEHHVITEDGYVLGLFRIPSDGPVVFLMHGLLGSADDYVIAGPDSGLAYSLAREGYDVWMGNARGNKHSRRHITLRPADPSFWDFSWHEIGSYDLPAMIDYVLETTNQTTLKYIGHSQGTTSFFVMASERPEYNEKISLMVALSPVAFMSRATSPLVRLLATGTPVIHGLTTSIGLNEFLPDNGFMRLLKLLTCGSQPMAEVLCSNALFLIAGFGFEQMNVTNLPVMFGHMPSGASAKQLAHYGQGFLSGEFRQFNYGAAENYNRYGSTVPPSYALENIVAPVSLFYSDDDWLAHPEDVDQLYSLLGNAVDIYKVPYKPFNHLDFLFAKDFNSLIYQRLRKLLLYF